MYRKLICFVFVVLMANSAMGYVAIWEGTVSADYNTAGNWDVGLVPIGSETNPYQYLPPPALPEECKALIDNWVDDVGIFGEPGYVAGYLLTPDYWPVIAGTCPEIRELKIANAEGAGAGQPGEYGELTMNSGYLYMDGDLEVGTGGVNVEGKFFMNGGTLRIGDDFRVDGEFIMTGGLVLGQGSEGLQTDRSTHTGYVEVSGGRMVVIEFEMGTNSLVRMKPGGEIMFPGKDYTGALAAWIADGRVMGSYSYDGKNTFLVPEPMTLALLGLGGLLIRRRRRLS